MSVAPIDNRPQAGASANPYGMEDDELLDVLGPAWDAQADDDASKATAVTVDDFYAIMPQHAYMFVPTRELWPAASVNGCLPQIIVDGDRMKASMWLDLHRAVQQLTWAPGEPMLINDRLVAEGGWTDRAGCTCFNLYRPPHVVPGDATLAGPWLDHIERVYPDAVDHLLSWLAHRVQRPGEKINHALVLGGTQGIGKDTILEPVKTAVGPWNFAEVSPAQLLGHFNGFVRSVILRVSEARDLGDTNRFAFYDHLKAYAAAPPDVLRCNEKNLREYAVRNVCGVVITTNYKTDGIYLPADDRRHYVTWSEATRDDFDPDYWRTLYGWYRDGGLEHVAAYLGSYDLSDFDPKAPPPKTPAFWEIVDANRAPEDAELADALDALYRPDAVTLAMITPCAEPRFQEWLRDPKNTRRIPHRLEAVGYVPVRNNDANDGRWKIGGKRQMVYARQELSTRDRILAVRRLGEVGR